MLKVAGSSYSSSLFLKPGRHLHGTYATVVLFPMAAEVVDHVYALARRQRVHFGLLFGDCHNCLLDDDADDDSPTMLMTPSLTTTITPRSPWTYPFARSNIRSGPLERK
jgi:hypothetical protein